MLVSKWEFGALCDLCLESVTLSFIGTGIDCDFACEVSSDIEFGIGA